MSVSATVENNPVPGVWEAGLGKLVPFDKRRRLGRTKGGEGAEAQILIFTGVRYDRGGTTLPTNGTTPARPKRKRV
jgi:hypothetical protein